MFKRIVAIAFIFICTTIAWSVLGSTIFHRTNEQRGVARGKVVSSWGGPHQQRSPLATYFEEAAEVKEKEVDGRKVRETQRYQISHSLPLESTRADVRLDLEHRQKGLLWYSTFGVRFSGRYVFRNPSPSGQEASFEFPLPAEHAIYDGLTVSLDGKSVEASARKGKLVVSAPVAAGATAELGVTYRSQGLDRWGYSFGEDVARVKDFELRASTNFAAIDFPESTLSPTTKERSGDGWKLAWRYTNLMSGVQIGVSMPERLQPGPLAGRISFFAPVSLLFFFFVMFIVTSLRRIDLHPMNYFFLAAAFFAFHLLLAYLADQVSIHAAFLISAAVSVFLVVSYLRLVVNARFAALEAGSAQVIYLVMFSYAFFFEGFTGLAVTIGAVLTLFVAMQLTARVKWGQPVAR